MKKFKDHVEDMFDIDKIPPCLSLMEENPKSSKENVLDIYTSSKYDSDFMTGKHYNKPISKFLKNYE